MPAINEHRMREMPRLREDDISIFLQAMGPERGKVTTEMLGKNVELFNAINSPLGSILLKDITELWEEKLLLIINEKDTEQDKADFRAIRSIGLRWAKKITAYIESVEKVAAVAVKRRRSHDTTEQSAADHGR